MDKIIKIISSVASSVADWITSNPKTALALLLFIVGFILGTLF